MTKDEAVHLYGGSTFRGVTKAVEDLFKENGVFPPLMGSIDKREAEALVKSVKAEKRQKQEEDRKRIEEERGRAIAAYDLRFSSAGVAASMAEGTGDKILAAQVSCLVPAGSGYDSSTGDSATINPFTKQKQIPKKIFGITGGCVNRLLLMNASTGSLAGVGFSRATGSSLCIKDGNTSDEREGIVRSDFQRDFVQHAPDLSSSDETFAPVSDIEKEYIAVASSPPQTGDIPSRS